MSEQRLDQLERRLSELEREIAAIRQEIRQERLVLPEPEPVKVDTVIATEATGVNASSGPEAKIALFMERFSGRLDVYARRWTSRKTGKSGWSPATRQGFYSKDTTPKDYLP
ncbi:MAG: helicase, partial [Corynebacterium glutamicum]|nr:helicase [Corynebacterium glutamicum]